MKVFVMRHGLTVWNEKGIIQGLSNNMLSKNGKEIIKIVAKELANTKFDCIYSSPLKRTMQTANLINIYQNVNIIKDKRLIEIDKGTFTGRLKLSLTDEEKILKDLAEKSTKMESRENVLKRVKSFVNDLLNKKYENVLVITHNIVASFLANLLLNKTIDLYDKKVTAQFENAEVRCFEINNYFKL